MHSNINKGVIATILFKSIGSTRLKNIVSILLKSIVTTRLFFQCRVLEEVVYVHLTILY